MENETLRSYYHGSRYNKTHLSFLEHFCHRADAEDDSQQGDWHFWFCFRRISWMEDVIQGNLDNYTKKVHEEWCILLRMIDSEVCRELPKVTSPQGCETAYRIAMNIIEEANHAALFGRYPQFSALETICFCCILHKMRDLLEQGCKDREFFNNHYQNHHYY